MGKLFLELPPSVIVPRRRLRPVDPNNEHPLDTAHRLVKRYRQLKSVDLLRLERATVREGSGMKWLPSWYLRWWNAPIDKPPAKGEIQERLYGQKGRMTNVNHASIVAEIPQLRRGQVWCTRCGATRKVNSGNALRHGWPECCGETMTIDSPEERVALKAQRDSAVSGDNTA